ncbi:ABC transporter substrate-binding protein [Dactylosporangium roseum]|uniref:ABC transporter substrate-binding protein n=1 Tax=Dactylosporangium roseum TaxID=47989 RepID=A0ABY5YZZ9_9ACTN|nr:transporter substrate-binding domain-containing protein [Dactylosporangium roseum]UWZ34423.1 ABC transporter substrate-binding protein [Dactylosporangium roseum]
MHEKRGNPKRGYLNRALASIAMLGLLAAAAMGCSSGGKDKTPTDLSVDSNGKLSQPTTITVALPARLGAFTDALMAQEWGEFQARNLKVDLKLIPSSDALVLLAKGDVDVVLTGISANLLNAASSGIDIRLAMPQYLTNPKGKTGWYVSTKALGGATFSPEMLKGKTVASSQGSDGASILGLVDTLRSANLTLKDVTVKKMASADMVTALENGAVFAAVVSEPLNVALEAKRSAVMFTSVSRPDWPPASAIFGPNLLKKHPAVAKAYAAAILATRAKLAGDYVNDPKRAPEVAKALDLSMEQLQSATSYVWKTDLRFPDGYVEQYQDIWKQADLLTYSTKLSGADIVDTSALDWAIGQR